MLSAGLSPFDRQMATKVIRLRVQRAGRRLCAGRIPKAGRSGRISVGTSPSVARTATGRGTIVKPLRFLSANPYKVREVQAIMQPYAVDVVGVDRKIDEIQNRDVELLVRDKVIKAFAILGRPVFVEHTGLELPGLNGLPGGLTQVFWDGLQADQFCSLVQALRTDEVVARTTIGYCNGKRLHFFDGVVRGRVAVSPRGPRDFQWDCVFVPEGESRTFAEMGSDKNLVSMRRRALDAFGEHLRSGDV